jgi:hypothetical protein
MSFFVQLGENIVRPMVEIWMNFIDILPGLLGGLLVLFFGFLLAEVVQLGIIKGLKKVNFDKFLHSLKISKTLEHFDIIHFVGVLLKWYIFVLFLEPAAIMAGLGRFSVLLIGFARWVPFFITASFVMMLAWVGADVLGAKVESTKIKEKHLISWFVKTFVLLFALVVALQQLGVSTALMNVSFIIILSAFAFGLALAFGIGFGLASKEDAKKAIKNVRNKLK